MRRLNGLAGILSGLATLLLPAGCSTPAPVPSAPPPKPAVLARYPVNGCSLLIATIDDTPYNRQHKFGGPMNGVNYITIHNTAEPFSAWHERCRVNNSQEGVKAVSFHFAVDENGAVQLLPLDQCGWHAGDGRGNGNMHSLAIEICRSACYGPNESLYRRAEANAVLLAAWLLDCYGLPDKALKKHQDWSGKFCPHRILEEHRWDDFVHRVVAARQTHRVTPAACTVNEIFAVEARPNPTGGVRYLLPDAAAFPSQEALLTELKRRKIATLTVSSWVEKDDHPGLLRRLRDAGINVVWYYAPPPGGGNTCFHRQNLVNGPPPARPRK